jgi:CheY-like chemotaxis protein
MPPKPVRNFGSSLRVGSTEANYGNYGYAYVLMWTRPFVPLPFSGIVFRASAPDPQSMQSAPPDPAGSAPSAAQGEVRVLLVEDHAGVREATRMLLKSEGYHVTAVGSLGEALELAQRQPHPDLLLTDYHLSDGETGLQVISALRKALRSPLKALLMTGDTPAAVDELMTDPHLRIASKPINAGQLLATLRELLSS